MTATPFGESRIGTAMATIRGAHRPPVTWEWDKFWHNGPVTGARMGGGDCVDGELGLRVTGNHLPVHSHAIVEFWVPLHGPTPWNYYRLWHPLSSGPIPDGYTVRSLEPGEAEAHNRHVATGNSYPPVRKYQRHRDGLAA